MTDKAQQISSLVEDLQTATAAGRSVNIGAVVAAHPHLMPELQIAIDELYDTSKTPPAPTSAQPSSATIARPSDPNSTIARPPVEGQNPDEKLTADAPGVSHPRGIAEPFHAHIQAPGYSITSELSRGGQAVVFLATQLSTGRKVAIKVMRDGPLADDRAMARFQREVEILAALNHPNIVSIIDTGKTSDGSQFIAMNYIKGVSLAEFMQQRHRKDPTDPGRLLRTFYKICMAVNEAHVRGIVHRDLKPNNIRVDERGEPHVLDFGLARTALDRFIRGSNHPVSISGEFLGSLPWSSPEQAEGNPDRIDIRTDVYSLGVILYQMLTGGRFPYEVVGNIRDVLNNILTAPPLPPSQLPIFPNVPPGPKLEASPADTRRVNEAIERVVLKALAKTRERRYQSAGELGKDVSNYLLGRPIPVVGAQPIAAPVLPIEIKPAQQTPEIVPLQRRSNRALLGSSIAAVVVGMICVLIWPRVKSPQADAMAGTRQMVPATSAVSVPNGSGPTPDSTGKLQPPIPAKVSDPQLAVDIIEYETDARRGHTLPFFERRGPLRYHAWLHEANDGDTMAQVFVARCLYEGVAVPQPDRAGALKWFEIAADKANAAAQLNIGNFYNTGEPGLIVRNQETAVQFYRQAADAGNATAMYNLGVMYRYGEGRVPTDLTIAEQWFEKAANLGNLYAIRTLATLYESGLPGVPHDQEKADKLWQKAIGADDDLARGYLASRPIALAYVAYVSPDATTAQRAAALVDVTKASECLDTFRLEALISVLSDGRIQNAAGSDLLKDPQDPLRQLHDKALERAIDLYSHATRGARRESLSDFVDVTCEMVLGWLKDKDKQRVADFWRDCFSDLTFAADTAGERDKTVNLMGAFVLCLLEINNRNEAVALLDDMMKFTDTVLADRPWDWYVKTGAIECYFEIAERLAQLNDQARSQAMLRRGWAMVATMRGVDGLVDRNPVLPPQGEVPDDASLSDQAFFRMFHAHQGVGPVKSLAFSCDFEKVKAPFRFYVIHGPNGYAELQDQIRWLWEYRRGTVPKDALDSFAELDGLAMQRHEDFATEVENAAAWKPSN